MNSNLNLNCRAIDNTKAAHKELDDKVAVADQAVHSSQSDVEQLQQEFNEASGLVQQKEKELREARATAEQKAKQLDVARYVSCLGSSGCIYEVDQSWCVKKVKPMLLLNRR